MPISQMTGLGVVALLLAAVVLCTAQPRELPRSVLGKARIILLYTRCIYELWLTALDWCTKGEGEGGKRRGEGRLQCKYFASCHACTCKLDGRVGYLHNVGTVPPVSACVCSLGVLHVEPPLVCPQPTGFGVCVESCSDDLPCENGQLCCSNGCGHACMAGVPGAVNCSDVSLLAVPLPLGGACRVLHWLERKRPTSR